MPARLKRHIFTYNVLVSGHNCYYSIFYGHNDSGVPGCIGKVLLSRRDVSRHRTLSFLRSRQLEGILSPDSSAAEGAPIFLIGFQNFRFWGSGFRDGPLAEQVTCGMIRCVRHRGISLVFRCRVCDCSPPV